MRRAARAFLSERTGAGLPDATFCRRDRLLAREEFTRIFSGPDHRVSDRTFTVLASRNAAGRARLGMAISKKAVRLATDRNRLKRQVREVFRTHPARRQHLDLIVMCKTRANLRPRRQLRESLDKLFTQLEEK